MFRTKVIVSIIYGFLFYGNVFSYRNDFQDYGSYDDFDYNYGLSRYPDRSYSYEGFDETEDLYSRDLYYSPYGVLNYQSGGNDDPVGGVSIVGQCLLNCVAKNINGVCATIFDCSWRCLSETAPPPNARKEFEKLEKSMPSQASKVRQVNSGTSEDAIIKFASCISSCLEAINVWNPLTLANFALCIVSRCLCGH